MPNKTPQGLQPSRASVTQTTEPPPLRAPVTRATEQPLRASVTRATEQPSRASVTRATEVYRELRDDIVRGKLMPSERLPVEVIRARYGSSATPIREALNRLASEGLVILKDQRGFSVAPVSLDHLSELTRTRAIINEIALRDSISRGDVTWEERVLVAHHRLSKTPMASDGSARHSPEWDKCHRAFHASLISACFSRWIMEMSDTLFEEASRYQHLSTILSSPRRDTMTEHRLLMEAVLSRDAELAVKLANDHINLTTEIVAPTIAAAVISEKLPGS
jgi:DNA-binding GntR family transcriptional regulator